MTHLHCDLFQFSWYSTVTLQFKRLQLRCRKVFHRQEPRRSRFQVVNKNGKSTSTTKISSMRRHGLATLGLVAVVTQCFVAPPLRPTRRGLRCCAAERPETPGPPPGGVGWWLPATAWRGEWCAEWEEKGRWHRQGGVLIWIFMGESESSLLGDAECTLLEDANMGWDRPTMRHGSGVDVLSHPQTCFCHWVENRSCSRPGGLFFGIASFKQICFTKTLVPRTWKASEVYPPKPY